MELYPALVDKHGHYSAYSTLRYSSALVVYHLELAAIFWPYLLFMFMTMNAPSTVELYGSLKLGEWFYICLCSEGSFFESSRKIAAYMHWPISESPFMNIFFTYWMPRITYSKLTSNNCWIYCLYCPLCQSWMWSNWHLIILPYAHIARL